MDRVSFFAFFVGMFGTLRTMMKKTSKTLLTGRWDCGMMISSIELEVSRMAHKAISMMMRMMYMCFHMCMLCCASVSLLSVAL